MERAISKQTFRQIAVCKSRKLFIIDLSLPSISQQDILLNIYIDFRNYAEGHAE